jgi:tetratricopeptide (TPR) repeat protein
MFTIGAGKSTLEVDGKFVFFQTLIDCLRRMSSSKKDTNELISYGEEQYKGDPITLKNLHKFHSSYSPDKAIWWYTTDSFFYATINAVLREQNIHMMFLWRSFLFDIYHELCKSQSPHKIKVYRGQKISKDELETLKKGTGQLVSVNSFLSTSNDRLVAVLFADDPNMPNDMTSVLFEIEADPLMVDTKPYADISKFSQFSEEQEILFMFGSIFRVTSVDHGAGHGVEPDWIIRMSLCDDDDKDVQKVLNYMQAQNGKGETNLRTLGKLLWKMGNYDMAEKYYRRFLNDLPPGDELRVSVYEDIAEIKSQIGDYNGSIDIQRMILQLKPSNTSK